MPGFTGLLDRQSTLLAWTAVGGVVLSCQELSESGEKEAEEGLLTFQQLPYSLASSGAHRWLSQEEVFQL